MKNLKYIFSIEGLVAFLFFLMLKPVFVWGTNMFFITYLLILILIFNYQKSSKNNKLLIFLLLILSIGPIHDGKNIFGILSAALFAFIPFVKEEFFKKSYHIFKFIFVIITAISLLIWIGLFLGISFPSKIIPPLNDLKTYNYLSYTFLVVPINFADIGRFSCVFDEPGAVGTYSLIMLFISNFNLKKYDNIIILIAGICSLSLFFYVSLFFFLCYKVFFVGSSFKARLITISLIVSFVISVLTVPVLNEAIGARIEYDKSTGKFAGDNRSGEMLDNHIESIKGTNAYFWGDSDENIEYFSAYAGLQTAILRYGVVFIILYFIFFFCYAYFRTSKRGLLLFMILLFVTLYQRPAFVNSGYLYLFTCAVLFGFRECEDIRQIAVNSCKTSKIISYDK